MYTYKTKETLECYSDLWESLREGGARSGGGEGGEGAHPD